MMYFQRFLRDESGATVIDYGLMVALTAVTLLTCANFLGDKLKSTMNEVADNLAS